MSITFTALAGLQYPAFRDRNWHLPLIASVQALDGQGGIGPLCCTLNENPSTSRVVNVAAGTYQRRDGTVATYGGGAATVPASQVTYLWLTDAGVLTQGTAFPTPAVGTNIVRIAKVTAGSTAITALQDLRIAWSSCGALVGPGVVWAGPASGAAAAPTFRALVGGDLPVFGASGAGHAAGAVPDPGASAGTAKFLREDATWVIPTIAVFGASGPSHSTGAVPDPGATAGSTRFLNENGSWAVPPGGAGGGVSIGSLVGSGTPGCILYVDPSGNLGQDASNFNWDDTHRRITIGSTAGQGSANVNVFDTPFTHGDIRAHVCLYDTSGAGTTAGIGGGVMMGGYITSGNTEFGGIKVSKANTTATDPSGHLDFETRSGTGAPTTKVRITALGSVILAFQGAVATNATDGFAYLPTCAGTPTGVPATVTGNVPVVFDSTNKILYCYAGGWQSVGGSSGGSFTGLVLAITEKTANYTATATDDTILVNANGGPITITLPNATTGTVYTIKKTDGTANIVSLGFTGSSLDAGGGFALTLPLQYVTVQMYFSVWKIIDTNVPALIPSGFGSGVDMSGLLVTQTEYPSASLNVRVGAGRFQTASGSSGAYGGTSSFTLPASTSGFLWLTDAGVLATGSGITSTQSVVQLASFTTDSSTITALYNQRIAWRSFGGPLTSRGRVRAISAKTANYTLVVSDEIVTLDATSGNVTATLPDATTCQGQTFTAKRIDASGHTCTVATTSSQTIDGAATYSLASQWSTVQIASNGTNWIITGKI